MKKKTIAIQTSESIKNQTAMFLKSGGSIQYIPNGKSGLNAQGGFNKSNKSADHSKLENSPQK